MIVHVESKYFVLPHFVAVGGIIVVGEVVFVVPTIFNVKINVICNSLPTVFRNCTIEETA